MFLKENIGCFIKNEKENINEINFCQIKLRNGQFSNWDEEVNIPKIDWL
jgi:hypothetical protein